MQCTPERRKEKGSATLMLVVASAPSLMVAMPAEVGGGKPTAASGGADRPMEVLGTQYPSAGTIEETGTEYPAGESGTVYPMEGMAEGTAVLAMQPLKEGPTDDTFGVRGGKPTEDSTALGADTWTEGTTAGLAIARLGSAVEKQVGSSTEVQVAMVVSGAQTGMAGVQDMDGSTPDDSLTLIWPAEEAEAVTSDDPDKEAARGSLRESLAGPPAPPDLLSACLALCRRK